MITSEAKRGVHGMTANAFMSAALNPALVLISLKNDNDMSDMIDTEGRFGVATLADGQQSISDHFAGRIQDGATVQFDYLGDTLGGTGALAWISYSFELRHIAGNHTLFIANVDDFLQSAGALLLFFDGQ